MNFLSVAVCCTLKVIQRKFDEGIIGPEFIREHIQQVACLALNSTIGIMLWYCYVIDPHVPHTIVYSLSSEDILSRYSWSFFDRAANANLSSTLVTDQKRPLSHLRISYQNFAVPSTIVLITKLVLCRTFSYHLISPTPNNDWIMLKPSRNKKGR